MTRMLLAVAAVLLAVAGHGLTDGGSEPQAVLAVESAMLSPDIDPTAVPNGGALPSDNGLLFVDLENVGMTFWAMPGLYQARPISQDGRWVAWSAEGVSGTQLLDTETGNNTALSLHGEPASASAFSADGEKLLLVSQSTVASLRLRPDPSSRKRRSPQGPRTAQRSSA